eukprot:GHUV01030013.1.p1 GENE.GHUV01030013.1~~GHUV01030013.1.p1  ORF type:complete len:130 (+),score=7.62 GHUV01030013.1:496-885(+)
MWQLSDSDSEQKVLTEDSYSQRILHTQYDSQLTALLIATGPPSKNLRSKKPAHLVLVDICLLTRYNVGMTVEPKHHYTDGIQSIDIDVEQSDLRPRVRSRLHSLKWVHETHHTSQCSRKGVTDAGKLHC